MGIEVTAGNDCELPVKPAAVSGVNPQGIQLEYNLGKELQSSASNSQHPPRRSKENSVSQVSQGKMRTASLLYFLSLILSH